MVMVVMVVMVVMLKHHQVSDSQLEGRSCLWVRDGPTEGTGIYRDSEKLPQDESRPTKESISYGVFVRVRTLFGGCHVCKIFDAECPVGAKKKLELVTGERIHGCSSQWRIGCRLSSHPATSKKIR